MTQRSDITHKWIFEHFICRRSVTWITNKTALEEGPRDIGHILWKLVLGLVRLADMVDDSRCLEPVPRRFTR